MRFTADTTTLITATLALSVAPLAFALPTPANNAQASDPPSMLSNMLGNIPFLGSFLGGGNAGSGTAATPDDALGNLGKHLPAPGSGLGGILSSGQIIGDHLKYTANPPLALQPIPAAENSPPRELHRQAHAALVPNQGSNQKPEDKS